MKKLLSIILILSLMLVNLSFFTVSAATNDNFAAAENWKIYKHTATALNDEDGEPVSWAYVSENTNSAFANGDSSSLKIFANSQYATLPITVEKNKNYTVSYKFYSESPSLGSTTVNNVKYSFLLNKTGIITPDHNVSPWNAENNYYDFITYNLAFKSENGLFSAKTENSQRTTHWTETGKWHTVELSFNSNDNTTVMLAIMPSVDSFYIDDVTITKEEVNGVTTAYNGKAALRTANASSTGKNGMRIYNSIEQDFIKDYNIVEYGSIAVLASNLDDELTLESTTTPFKKGIAYSAESQPTPILYETTETEYIFTSYLTNIPTVYYGEDYLIRAYAIASNGEVYYGDITTLSVFEVAHAIDCGDTADTQTDNDIAAFKAFAKGNDNYKAYDEWLISNDKSKGALRMELTTYKITDIKDKYKIQGRYTYLNNSLMIDYSASGIEFNANCEGDVYITFNAGWLSNSCYFTVIVDGIQQPREFLNVTSIGESKMKIAENLKSGNHSFKLYRQTEIEFARIGIVSISLNGEFSDPPENKDLFIEYVGASTSCGYGNLATSSTPSADVNTAEYEDATQAFTYLSAQKLNADWSIVARQGTGVAYGWQKTSLIDIYPYLRHMYDSTTEYDFARQPDYIVIGASGNDISAFNSKTSISHIPNDLTLADIEQGYIDFLTLLREKNPNAKIIYLANFMSDGAIPYLNAAVEAKGGAEAGFYVLHCTRNNDGGKNHPSAAGHSVNAKEIADFISSLEAK